MTDALAPRIATGAVRRKNLTRWVGVLIAGYLILAILIGGGGNSKSEAPSGSSYGVKEFGVGALADLAEKFDYQVRRLRVPLSKAIQDGEISQNSTVVVLSASFEDSLSERLQQFVDGGGRVIVGDSVGMPKGFEIADASLRSDFSEAQLPNARVAIPSRPDIRELTVRGSAAFVSPANDTELVGSLTAQAIAWDADRPIAYQATNESGGTFFLLADWTALSNELLAFGDNAAFALHILGPVDRPVVFAEETHGFSDRLDATGLPRNVRWFIGGLLAATLALMWTRSRRNGPPELRHRELAPARSDYARSLGAAIDRRSGYGKKRRLTRFFTSRRSTDDPPPSIKPPTNV